MEPHYVPLDKALQEYGLSSKPRGLPTIECVDLATLESIVETSREFVTVPEAARMLHRAQSQIYNQYVPQGVLTPIVIGGRKHFRRTEVATLRDRLASRVVIKEAPPPSEPRLPRWQQFTFGANWIKANTDSDDDHGTWTWPNGQTLTKEEREERNLPLRWDGTVDSDQRPTFLPEDYEEEVD